MKFECGKAARLKAEALMRWHRWFAWFPVKVGEEECRWLEWIERKGERYGCYDGPEWEWKYRSNKND